MKTMMIIVTLGILMIKMLIWKIRIPKKRMIKVKLILNIFKDCQKLKTNINKSLKIQSNYINREYLKIFSDQKVSFG